MLLKKLIRPLAGLTVLLTSLVIFGYAIAQEPMHAKGQGGQSMPIPSSIKAEHNELHEKLHRLTQARGKTGAAAKEVEKLLQPHFIKEEEFALPPLGALPILAAGHLPPDADAIVRMAERLKAELPTMLSEHKKVVGALEHLRKAGREENNMDAVQFVEQLSAHALQEEQILYPSAIMVGEYIKLKPK